MKHTYPEHYKRRYQIYGSGYLTSTNDLNHAIKKAREYIRRGFPHVSIHDRGLEGLHYVDLETAISYPAPYGDKNHHA